MKTPVLKIYQNGMTFYCAVFNVSILKKICRTDMEDITSGNGVYQRTLDRQRVNKIAQYVLNNKYGTMPPAIILNSLQKLVIEDNSLIIDEENDKFFIIDGQHRLEGAFCSKKEPYDFCTIIMDNVDFDYQSELFITINEKQKKVNQNIKLMVKANSVFNPEKVIVKLASFLNEWKESPFYQMIKMGDGRIHKTTKTTISLNSFSELLLSYFYNPSFYDELKDTLKENNCIESTNGCLVNRYQQFSNKIFWYLYTRDRTDIITKILVNYFNALKRIFKKSWGNKEYLVTKTTGYNAIMLLFEDVYKYCELHDYDFTEDFMYSFLNKLETLDYSITLSNYGLGKAGSYLLYVKMYELVFGLLDNFDFSKLDYIDDNDDEDFANYTY